MKRLPFLITVCLLILLACNDSQKEGKNQSTPEPQEKSNDSDTASEVMKLYVNDRWHFQLSYPQEFSPLESELAGNVPVINLYKTDTGGNPPFAFHEDPEHFYFSIMPKGFGTEYPNGKQLSLEEWEDPLPLNVPASKQQSKVFLLENDQPWAVMLNFDNPPKGWGDYGGIFIHLPISNFEAKCFTVSGEEKPMTQCDPMGDDSVKLKGSVSEEDWNTMLRMLETLEFYEGEREERPISELVQITKPLPNTEVTSPLTIEGKARGFWYFEGDFPLRLVDKDDAILLYEGPVSANGKWMTEDFVPFSTTITFEAPDDERGYLVFERDNPSGIPENNRSYRLPILFPPK